MPPVWCDPRPLFHGKRVLEIGSGVGLSGLVASRVCDAIVLSDYMPAIVANLQYNVALNTHDGSSEHGDARAVALDWCGVGPGYAASEAAKALLGVATDGTARFDVVFGSDVVYRREDADMIAAVLRELLACHGVDPVVATGGVDGWCLCGWCCFRLVFVWALGWCSIGLVLLDWFSAG